MSQAVITKAFVEWKAQQATDNKPVVLDEFIFANVPDQDANAPIDNTEGVPTDSIVWRQAVSKSGVVNASSVVYSVTMGADTGNFDFNWIGLADKATGTLAMIIHAPTQSKVKNDSGNQGNVLVRSMLMEFSGAQAATAITTPAETWQIDFTARLAGMDEATRLAALDVYGKGAFFGDGFLVTKNGTKYAVTHGLGYVGGLRAPLAAGQTISPPALPVKVWADVCYKGTLTSARQPEIKFTAAEELDNYTVNGEAHFVFAVASIDDSGTVTDLRPKGTLDEQQGSKDFLRKDKNLSDLDDADKSRKNIGLGDIATHDVKEFVPVTRTINKKKLDSNISLNASDVGAVSTEGGDIGYLDNASHYAIKNEVWQGSGAFQNQLADKRALLYSEGFTASGNAYLPMVKAPVMTEGKGWLAAISYGVLTSGNNDYPSACIHIFSDNKIDHIWQFNPNDNSFNSPGPVCDTGHRCYSPVNPPPQQDLSPYATFAWVQQCFVQDIRQAGLEYHYAGEDTGTQIAPAGAVFVGTQVNGEWDDNEGFYYTYMQKNINGVWYTVARI